MRKRKLSLLVPIAALATCGTALSSPSVPSNSAAAPRARIHRQEKDSGGLAQGFTRDSDLAKRLAARGYRTPAEWVVARLKTLASLTEEQKAAIQYLEASIAIAAFDNERDFDKSKGFYDKAKAAITAYLTSAPKGQFANEANYESGDLDRKLGEKCIAQIKVEGNSEKIAELRKMGEAAFQASNDYFQRRVVAAKDEANEQNVSLSEYQPWLAAAYAIPNNYLTWAFIYPPGDTKRTDNLRRACTNFDEFLLNVSDETVLYFEAYVKYGNARRELGQADDATECYNLALQLLFWSDDQNTKALKEPADLSDNERQLILNAAAEISKLWLVKTQYEDILKVYADCKKAIPNMNQIERGAEFMLEVAKTFEVQGKRAQAIDEAKKILAVAIPGSALFSEAKDLLDRLGGGSDLELTGPQVFGPTVALINEAKFTEAVRVYNQTMERIRGTAAEQKFSADLMFWGGRAYQGAGRGLEAILTWSFVGGRYSQNKEVAPKAYYAAILQICQLWTTTKFSWLEVMGTETLEQFQSAFPEHELLPQAQDLFLTSQKKVGGKPPLELAKLVEEQLKGVAKSDAKFGRLTYDAGKSYYTAGQQSKKKPEKEQARVGAERLWEQYLEWVKAQTTLDPAEKSRIDERVVFVLLSRAQMWLWEPGAAVEKAFALVAQIEEMMAKVPAAKAKTLEVDQVKVKAYLQQGSLDKAIAIIEGMLTKASDSPRTAFELKRVSDFTWNELTRNADKLAPERMTQLLDWGIRYNREWVNTGDKIQGSIDSNDLSDVGKRMFQFGLLKNGLSKYPGTFYLIDLSKFAFQEATQLSADYFGKALTAYSGNNADLVNTIRYRRGAALGILQRWKEVVDEYSMIVKNDEILEPVVDGGNYKVGPPKQGRSFPTEKFLNDYAYALAEVAKKFGDKAAGTEAQRIAGAVVVAVEPKGGAEPPFEFWFARYIAMHAADANGERKAVVDRYVFYTRTDKELDGDKFGFRKKMIELFEKNK